jgi:hypothetical protein
MHQHGSRIELRTMLDTPTKKKKHYPEIGENKENTWSAGPEFGNIVVLPNLHLSIVSCSTSIRMPPTTERIERCPSRLGVGDLWVPGLNPISKVL